MRFEYRYYGESAVSSSASATQMHFAPDTLRPPTHFVAEVNKHIPFREAMSALHQVVVADERYQAPDKSVYKAWLAQNEEAMLAEHSARGAAMTQLGVQKERPSLFDLEPQLRQLKVPTLVVTGDEDHPCLVPGLFLKRVIPSTGLLVVPNTGHTINIEEAAIFNTALQDFITLVDAGRWPMRDPRAVSESITGVKT